MSLKSAFIFVCENYILDVDNKVSIINIIGTIKISKLPHKLPYWVYSTALGWEGKHKLKMTMVTPQGNEEILGQIKVDFPGYKQSHIYLEPLREKEFKEYGEYVLRLYIDDECSAENFISVIPLNSED